MGEFLFFNGSDYIWCKKTMNGSKTKNVYAKYDWCISKVFLQIVRPISGIIYDDIIML